MEANVVLISVDCLRADCLASIDRKGGITFNIDRLAERGILFTKAFSTSSWTPPAFKSIMASQYPFSNNGYLNVRDSVTLPVVMKWLGYKTAAFHSNPWLTKGFGYNKGFDYFYDLVPHEKSIFRKFSSVFKYLKIQSPYINANDLTEYALNWISKNKDTKFFVFIHFMDAHEPHIPIENFPLPLSIVEQWKIRVINKKAKEGSISNSELSKLKEWYRQEVRNIDNCIGYLTNVLDDLNILEKTYIILLGDHGQQFFEHGMFGHGLQLYNELIHVPLVILGQNIEKQRVEKPVSLIDVVPTILDLLKYNVKTLPFYGKSLFTYINQDKEREVISEEGRSARWGPEKGVDAKLEYSNRKISLILSDWKYIYNVDKEDELYNLRKDFQEKNNLINQEKEIASKMFNKIKKFIKWLGKSDNEINILRQKIKKMKLKGRVL